MLSQLQHDRIAREQAALAPSPLSPETKLAAAVLRQAVDDLRRGKPGARLWFESRYSFLPFWCDVLALDAEMVRSHALGIATTSKAGTSSQAGYRS